MARASVDWHEQSGRRASAADVRARHAPDSGRRPAGWASTATPRRARSSRWPAPSTRAKPMHRLVAWVLLAVFCVPLVITILDELT